MVQGLRFSVYGLWFRASGFGFRAERAASEASRERVHLGSPFCARTNRNFFARANRNFFARTNRTVLRGRTGTCSRGLKPSDHKITMLWQIGRMPHTSRKQYSTPFSTHEKNLSDCVSNLLSQNWTSASPEPEPTANVAHTSHSIRIMGCVIAPQHAIESRIQMGTTCTCLMDPDPIASPRHRPQHRRQHRRRHRPPTTTINTINTTEDVALWSQIDFERICCSSSSCAYPDG